MIKLILNHARTDDLQSKWNFEENASLARIVFGTSFHVVNEDLGWEEDVAELTLHRNSVLEYPLVDFNRADFLRELPITLLHVRDSLRQVLIRPH